MSTAQLTSPLPNTVSSAVGTLVNLGTSLRSHRLAKRMTHEQVAEACGFSRQTLSRIERGDPSVAIGQVIRYAAKVGGEALFQLEPSQDIEVSRKRVRRTQAEMAQVAA